MPAGASVEVTSVMTMALRRFGARCPPLVCTAGWPTGAGILLLSMLAHSELLTVSARRHTVRADLARRRTVGA